MQVHIDRDAGRTLTVFQGDVEEAVEHIEPSSVDLVVTSPPYKLSDGYSDRLMERLGELLYSVLKDGARAFINFGQLRDDFSRLYDARECVRLSGLETGQTIAWVKSIAMPSPAAAIEQYLDALPRQAMADPKRIRELLRHAEPRQYGHYQPINSTRLLNYCWELVYTFYKTEEPDFDRLSVGVPFTDKSNMSRGQRGRNGDLHCGGDAWFVPYETTGRQRKKGHRHEYPEELVRRCILVSGVPRGSVVLEPFGGGGTTPSVSKLLGMDSVVVERDPSCVDELRRRWMEVSSATS